ncbi:beta-ketoacyl-[acyl-carrier-protein] synthase family protein [Streptomyces sp. AV19]|uniref:beta-ketoacyl-[acyl-carrier-protein] synthase family protein n=1 Tax=Streptomyces sp. AV19 TaxID=2793068 RepID=UPI0018FE1D8D|nr:beta-ketoacyl-[acyl-carrier-protein] synthase family protein [Streptomyces sp. AV19]MBH1937493.1 beta-ketoacyl-[acyl-carrier-protein] synthase family protein [Streptomyces sp. AV19]MDG4533731.1 beta-ketoacyl-[acyl-carrier-protein] synthase family protein [Streptomyces sp. AV19]
MSRPEVVVTGLGMVTPAGVGTKATWQGVSEGVTTAAPDPDLAGLPVDFSCRVPDFDPGAHLDSRALWRTDRCAQLAVAAAWEGVRDAGLDPGSWDGARVAVIIGTAFGGQRAGEDEHRRLLQEGHEAVAPTLVPKLLPNMPAGEVSMALRAHGMSLGLSAACASGANAIALGRDLLASGSCDVAIAGGTDAAVTPLLAAGFHRLGTLSVRRTEPAAASRPFDAGRDGFVLGEAAAVLVLERAEDARRRGAAPRAVLAGCGSTSDAYRATAPHPEHLGGEAALRAALADADATPAEVDHVNAHGTATLVNDATEALMLARVLPHAPSVTSAKGALGHCMGASGAVEAGLTVLTLQRQLVPPTANLDTVDPDVQLDLVTKTAREQRVDLAVSTSFGFGGHNAVLSFRRCT